MFAQVFVNGITPAMSKINSVKDGQNSQQSNLYGKHRPSGGNLRKYFLTFVLSFLSMKLQLQRSQSPLSHTDDFHCGNSHRHSHAV